MRTHAEIEAAHQRRAKRAQKREAKQRRRHVQRERQRQQRARCLSPRWETQGQAHRHALRAPEQDADDHDDAFPVPSVLVPRMQHGLRAGPMALAQVGGAIARHEAHERVAGARARRQANAEVAVKVRQQRDRRQRQTVIKAVEERWLRRREAAQEEREARAARRREQEDAHRAARDLTRAALMYKYKA